MKKQLLAVALMCSAFGIASTLAPQLLTQAQEKKPKLLRHVVLFKFKPDVSQPQVKEVTDAFAALPQKIDTIHSFEWGTDISVENKSEGFTHCFLVTFQSAEGRDKYLPHPAHQEFVKLVGPRLEKVLVVDYWTN